METRTPTDSLLPQPTRLDIDAMPEPVLTAFQEEVLIPDGENPTFWRFDFGDEGASYTYAYGGQNQGEIVVIDFDTDDQVEGDGVIQIDRTDPQSPTSKPFVEHTETVGEKNRGLGTRRLRVMNDVAQRTWGQPLHSAAWGFIEDEAISVWRRLAERGEVEEYQEAGYTRWRFNS